MAFTSNHFNSLCAALADTLRMLEAAYRDLGMSTERSPRILKASAVLAAALAQPTPSNAAQSDQEDRLRAEGLSTEEPRP